MAEEKYSNEEVKNMEEKYTEEQLEAIVGKIDKFTKNLMTLCGMTIAGVETLCDIEEQSTLSTQDLNQCRELIEQCNRLLNFEFRSYITDNNSKQNLQYTVSMVDTGIDDNTVTLGDSFANVQSYFGDALTQIRRIQSGDADTDPARAKEIIQSAFGVLGLFVIEVIQCNMSLIEKDSEYMSNYEELTEYMDVLSKYQNKDYYKDTKTRIHVDSDDVAVGEKIKLEPLSFSRITEKE